MALQPCTFLAHARRGWVALGYPCNIDIVFLHEASLQLQFHVIRDGKILFEEDANFRATYHERVMEAHADFAPLQRIFHEATLSRI